MRNRSYVVWFMLVAMCTLSMWLSTTTYINAQNSQSTDKSEFARNLIVKITGDNVSGSGIVFGQIGDILFIATANHVVRRGTQEAQNLRVQFNFWFEAIEAKLVQKFDRDFDLAVLRVKLEESDLNSKVLGKFLPFTQLNYIPDVQAVSKLYPVGHPPGRDWFIPMTPHDIYEVEGEIIRFDFQCDQGYSGGGVFDENWGLVGMVTRFNPPLCEAVSFERIQTNLEKWRFVVSLKPRKSSPPEPTATPVPLSTATSILPESEVWTEPVTGMEFVWVPAGCFKMGSPKTEKERDSDKEPEHEVCVDGFWMGKTEVTNKQYRIWKPNHDSQDYEGHTLNSDDQPVIYVSWADAKDFASWLKQRNGGKYSFRLPTEAEWEYACRAGTTTARFWGDDPDKACQFANVYDQTSKRVNKFDWSHHGCDDGYVVTSPVGNFQPNAFNLYDMLGNLWEWCEDTYSRSAYSKHQRNNPIYASGGPNRVRRGGGWSDRPRGVRCATRYDFQLGYRLNDVGFRLVMTY